MQIDEEKLTTADRRICDTELLFTKYMVRAGDLKSKGQSAMQALRHLVILRQTLCAFARSREALFR